MLLFDHKDLGLAFTKRRYGFMTDRQYLFFSFLVIVPKKKKKKASKQNTLVVGSF
jgi:hypothetical protein